MKKSRIDGKGLLPYTCLHGKGYNGCFDSKICVKCAEDRAEELEAIIAKFGNGLVRLLKDPTYDVVLSINRLLVETSKNFNDRPALPLDPPFERDLGKWLIK